MTRTLSSRMLLQELKRMCQNCSIKLRMFSLRFFQIFVSNGIQKMGFITHGFSFWCFQRIVFFKILGLGPPFFSLGPQICPKLTERVFNLGFSSPPNRGVHRFPTTNPLTPTQPSSPAQRWELGGGMDGPFRPLRPEEADKDKKKGLLNGVGSCSGVDVLLERMSRWVDGFGERINGCRWLQRCGSRIALRRIGLETGEND